MRAIWKGAVAFGLVNVPVKLYAATGEHQVALHQVHGADAGRVRYRRVCSVCGEELSMADIDKGYETADGEMVVLTDADLADLPLATEREIEVLEFVPADQVDPILLAKTYYLEPEGTAAKAYTLLREALASSERMAVVKVALRQRESMAVLRVRGDVICMQTLLWPDEVRAAEFPILDKDVTVRPQELAMASSLIESMAADFDPSEYEDSYASALEQMIEAKIASGTTVTPPAPLEVAASAEGGGEVVDLLAALQRSVDSARSAKVAAEAPDGAAAGLAASKPAASNGAKRPAAAEAEVSAPAAAAAQKPKTVTAAAKGSARGTAAAKGSARGTAAAKGSAGGTAAGKIAAEEAADSTEVEPPAKRPAARRRAS
jgi:DNA end-binding protein Ku